MLLGIILKLKGNPPAGDGGLQCSVKEGTHSANKVSNTFFFSHGSVLVYFISHPPSLCSAFP